jgi:uncharacterized Zn finger protein (UPF0148 family)
MDSEKFNRTVPVLCPTCGGSQFSEGDSVTCVTCNRVTTRDELLRDNQENFQAHAKEIGEAAVEDVRKGLKEMLAEAFKGSSVIKLE